MDLLQHLRSERAEKRKKQPFAPTLFDRINGLVKTYALGEAFLGSLDAFEERLREEDLTLDRVRPKRPYDPPLFSLSTEEEYRVTIAVINKAGNPYLNFVNSPDEILLCGPLFRHNPSLAPERLARFHFEALLLAEVGRKQIHHLTEQVHRLLERQEGGRADGSQLSTLQARIEGLRRVVARLESPGRGQG